MTEVKKLEDLTDEEFEKASEAGDINLSPEEETKEEKPEEESIEEETEEEESEIDEEDDDDEIEEDKSPHIPYAKFKKQKEKWSEKESLLQQERDDLQAKLDGMAEKSNANENVDDELESFITETGLDKKVVTGLLNIAKKQIQPSTDLEKRLEAFEQRQAEADAELVFEKGYNDSIVPALKEVNESVTDAQLLKAKDHIRGLIVENPEIPVEYLLSHHQDDILKIIETPKGKTSAESSRPGAKQGTRDFDPESITGDDIENMSDEEFEKFSKEMEKKAGSNKKLYRKGQLIT